MDDFVVPGPHYVNVRRDKPSIQEKWEKLEVWLNEGRPINPRPMIYLEAGAQVPEDHVCIFSHRTSSAPRMPNVLLRFGADRIKISVRTLFYLGAYKRIALLSGSPACRNRHCVNPHHQHECYIDNGDSRLKVDMTVAKHRDEVVWMQDLVPQYDFVNPGKIVDLLAAE